MSKVLLYIRSDDDSVAYDEQVAWCTTLALATVPTSRVTSTYTEI